MCTWSTIRCTAYIEADSDRLLQVMTNLLSNAIKFSPPDSTVRIMLTVRAADGVTVSVVDEGRGIPADKLEASSTASSR